MSANFTQIAEATGVSIQPVKDTLSDFSEGVPKNLKVQSLFNDTDFTPLLDLDAGRYGGGVQLKTCTRVHVLTTDEISTRVEILTLDEIHLHTCK